MRIWIQALGVTLDWELRYITCFFGFHLFWTAMCICLLSQIHLSAAFLWCDFLSWFVVLSFIFSESGVIETMKGCGLLRTTQMVAHKNYFWEQFQKTMASKNLFYDMLKKVIKWSNVAVSLIGSFWFNWKSSLLIWLNTQLRGYFNGILCSL